MTASKPWLIVLSAPSGAGKTSLAKKILAHFEHIKPSISCTTRPPRNEEKNEVDYFFITHEIFQKKIKNQEFIEWAQVHHHYYGTSRETLEGFLKTGFSVLLTIDVQGAQQLKKNYPPDSLHLIFIMPPDLQTLEKRLRNRGTDSEDSIQKRLLNAKKEIEASNWFDTVILNDNFDCAYQDLATLLKLKLHLSEKIPVEGS